MKLKKADFSYWAKRDTLSLNEFAFLQQGKNPIPNIDRFNLLIKNAQDCIKSRCQFKSGQETDRVYFEFPYTEIDNLRVWLKGADDKGRLLAYKIDFDLELEEECELCPLKGWVVLPETLPKNSTLWIKLSDGTYDELMEFHKYLYKVAALCEDAIALGDLSIRDCITPPVDYMEKRVHITELQKWAKSKQLNFPEELSVLRRDKTKNIDERERDTFLKIISVLAKECKLDLSRHYPAAKELEVMAVRQRKEVPSKETIANKLRDAHRIYSSE